MPVGLEPGADGQAPMLSPPFGRSFREPGVLPDALPRTGFPSPGGNGLMVT
jgi:hypothetical protein